jgi:hypothetical protein
LAFEGQLAWAAWFSFGAAAAAGPTLVTAARLGCQQVLRRLLVAAAFGAGFMFALDGIVQLAVWAKDHRLARRQPCR